MKQANSENLCPPLREKVNNAEFGERGSRILLTEFVELLNVYMYTEANKIHVCQYAYKDLIAYSSLCV